MSNDFTTARHWMAGLSALGAANMGLGALRQFGIVSHLPDPPIAGFDSNAVMVSEPAFALGMPDTPIAMSGLLANIPLSLAGGRRRHVTTPWLPVGIAAKAVVEVTVAGWYLVQMRTRLHLWCAYCLAGATIDAVLAVLALREANAALQSRRARAAGAIGAVLIAGVAFTAMSMIDARHRRQLQERNSRTNS